MPTPAEIQAFYEQNKNNPAAIQSAMQQYNVTPEQAAQATGQNISQFTLGSGLGQPTPAQPAQQQTPGGMYVAGQYYTPQQIKDFYAGGGDPAQFAQQHGITDLTQIHDLATQSRGIAGASAPTGDAALQAAFKQYQQYSPNGANAGNYGAFVNDLPANVRDAIKAGTYSGQTGAIDQKDWAPGGIYGPGSQNYGQAGYASGLGPRGMGNLGGGYGTGGAATGQAPSGSGSSVTGMPPPSSPTGPTGFQTSSRPMAGQITGMLDQGLQYGLGSGLQPTTQTPLAGAQNAVSNILGGPTSQQSATPVASNPTQSVGNVAIPTETANTASQQTAPAMGQGQPTTQMQKFQSLVSSIPVGNPTPFGGNAQITRQPNGAIMVTGPSLSKPYVLDSSLSQDQLMQQLQAIYSMVNAPPSGG